MNKVVKLLKERRVDMNSICKLRRKLSMSQHDLAEAMNVTQSAIAKWEAGESKPRSDKLPELAKIFGCSIDDLFESEQEKSRPA